MNIKEAYDVLGVKKDISDDELKKVYKELAKKYHPDIHKEDPEKFKKINEAYQLVKDRRNAPPESIFSNGPFRWSGSNLDDMFENFQEPDTSPIELELKISFHEAVQGCSHSVAYSRKIKCSGCRGRGFHPIKNDCTNCDGFGFKTSQHRNAVFQSSCGSCGGRGVSKKECDKCDGDGATNDDVKGTVSVPPGARDGNVLAIKNAGNYMGAGFFGDQYTNVMIRLNVEPYKDFQIEGQDVSSNLEISLLEALEGLNKEVDTVYGSKTIVIPKMSKNRDRIKIDGCGVKGTRGSHIVEILVCYPTDPTKLIGVLKDAVSNPV